MPAGRIKGQKLSSEQLEAYRAKRREKKDKWGGEAFKRKEESDAPFIDVGFYMTVTWSTGRQIPRRKMQP